LCARKSRYPHVPPEAAARTVDAKVSVFDLTPLAEAIDVEVLSAHLTEVMLDEVYSHVIDPKELQPLLVEATAEKLGALADLIAGEVTLDELQAPSALAFAGEVGRQGIAEWMLERSYRVGNEALWDAWLNVVERHCAETGDAVGDVVRASIPVLFGFVDRMLFASLASYHQAVAARQQTREYRRARLVEQLLDGTLTEAGIDTERFIGYAFGHHHLAAVLDGGDWTGDQQLAEELKRASRASHLVVLDRNGAPTQLWLGLRGPLSPAIRSALESCTASTGRRIAFGEVKPGLGGFRASASSARDAARVQELLADNGPQVIWAEDVRIEMLALNNPDGARALVSSVLGTALDRGLLTTRVRETLDAWLTSGSYVGAAATLGVHEQTVRQRLHQLEDALGHSLHERRTDLHVALRLSLLSYPATATR
jgi:DNA-binding PucR family transcriptional regulator